jgi:hypothetical protein
MLQMRVGRDHVPDVGMEEVDAGGRIQADKEQVCAISSLSLGSTRVYRAILSKVDV